MARKIIKIDEDKCIGCELCTKACKEGAIGMVDGKAKLLRDDYCDGLGNCLPVCPMGAITLEEREGKEIEEVRGNNNYPNKKDKQPCGCPSTKSEAIKHEEQPCNCQNGGEEQEGQLCACKPEGDKNHKQEEQLPCGCSGTQSRVIRHVSKQNYFRIGSGEQMSRLSQWPVQIKLVPTNAPYFENAHLLIAADCSAYAYGDFHNKFIRNRVTVIGCPKLDEEDYSKKLASIIRNNNIKSVTVVRMEVPCCSGLVGAVKKALMESGKFIPWQIVIISTDGNIIE